MLIVLESIWNRTLLISYPTPQQTEKYVNFLNSVDFVLNVNNKIYDDVFYNPVVNDMSCDFDANSSYQNLNQNAYIPFIVMHCNASTYFTNISTRTFPNFYKTPTNMILLVLMLFITG